MKHIITIAKKEFIDTLRDRRTILMMVVIPLLLFPVLMYAITIFQVAQAKKAREQQLAIGIISNGQGQELLDHLRQQEDIDLYEDITADNITEIVRSDSMDMLIKLPDNFDILLDSMGSAELSIVYQSTDDSQLKRRLRNQIDAYEESVLAHRLNQLAINEQTIDPINIQEEDVATKQEVVGKLAGGFLPYIFIIFCFMGCMYPAIDLFTGEKERSTLETILTLPVQRIHILTGKMAVVAFSGLCSALLALLGLFVSIHVIDAIPADLLVVIADMLQAKSILLMLALLLPLTIFFAGILVPIASYAKTFKEAQSMITPLNFMVIIPAAIALTPGIELDFSTVFIPILNVALSIKEIVAGTIDPGLLLLVFASLLILASGSLFLSVRGFSKEQNILRA